MRLIHEKNLRVCFPTSKRENGQKPNWTKLTKMDFISNGLLALQWVSIGPQDPNRCPQWLWMTNWLHTDQSNHNLLICFNRTYQISIHKWSKIDLKGQICKRWPKKPIKATFPHSFNPQAWFIHDNIKNWLLRFIFVDFGAKITQKWPLIGPKYPKNTFNNP